MFLGLRSMGFAEPWRGYLPAHRQRLANHSLPRRLEPDRAAAACQCRDQVKRTRISISDGISVSVLSPTRGAFMAWSRIREAQHTMSPWDRGPASVLSCKAMAARHADWDSQTGTAACEQLYLLSVRGAVWCGADQCHWCCYSTMPGPGTA